VAKIKAASSIGSLGEDFNRHVVTSGNFAAMIEGWVILRPELIDAAARMRRGLNQLR